MSLSFREEAVLIAFRLSANNSDIGRGAPADLVIKAIAIASAQAAQTLAEACCQQFGHDGMGIESCGERGKGALVTACTRCGALP